MAPLHQRFAVRHEIFEGTFCKIVAATDYFAQRQVAIKILHDRAHHVSFGINVHPKTLFSTNTKRSLSYLNRSI
jgi:hypothetical protein